MVLAWLLFPAVALAVAGGVGLLLERASGTALPGALLVPAGIAGTVALGQVTTYWDWSAELTVPLVVVAALAGWILGRTRVRAGSLDGWAIAAAAGVFAVFAAPIVLSGQATFGGYTQLGDTAIQFIGADALLHTGRDIASLPPSTYQFALSGYYDTGGYPSGGQVAAGALSSLVRQDIAWTYQAFLTLLAATTVLSLWSLVTPVVRSRPLRALVVFVAGQPAIVLAYALQGSIKEIGTVFAVTLVAALVPVYVAKRAGGPRRVVPLAVAVAAAVAIVGPVGILWVGPLLAGALIAAALSRPQVDVGALALQVALFVAIAVLLSYQSLIQLTAYADVAGGVVQAQQELGNLFGPLSRLQAGGIWLIGDYRYRPAGDNWLLTRELLLLVALGAVLGCVWLVRRRAWPVLLFLGVSVFACAFVIVRGSPWADAKALMIVSPAVLLAAMLGAAALYGRSRAFAILLGGLVTIGVLASNALAYRSVSVAPRDRMQELASIGDSIDGPTLFPQFDEFAKHFLRKGEPDIASEAFQRSATPWKPAQGPRFGYPTDLDQLTDADLQLYRTVVTPHGFAGSRPPSSFKRVREGQFYDVWQHVDGGPRLIEHLSVGGGREPAGTPACGEVKRLAGEARQSDGTLRYVEREPAVGFALSDVALPGGWVADPNNPGVVQPTGPGRVERIVSLPSGGRWDLFIEGSDTRPWRVLVDGKQVADKELEISYRGGQTHLATLNLPAGNHSVTLERGGGSLGAGNAAIGRIGPVAFVQADAGGLPVSELDPAQWRELCGKTVDWIEAVA